MQTVKQIVSDLAHRLVSDGYDYEQATVIFERAYLHEMAEQCKGNQCKMAVAMKVHRNTVARLAHDRGVRIQKPLRLPKRFNDYRDSLSS